MGRLVRGVPDRSLHVTRNYNSDAADPGKIKFERTLKVVEVYKLLAGMPLTSLSAL